MKSTYRLVNNFQAVVDNGRNKGMIMDLPPGKGGDDSGPTALEVLAMSLSGCIGTIFALIAKKMRIEIDDLKVVLEADKGAEDPTITAVRADVFVKSAASEEKLKQCLNTTMNTCPVGKLYEQADVPIEVKIIKE